MNDLAKKAGFKSAAEVASGNRASRENKGRKPPPKYQNPTEPSKTWTGQDRAPGWLLSYEKKRGKKRDDLLIQK